MLNHEASKDSIPFDSLEKSVCSAASQPFVTCVEKDRRTDKRPDVYVSSSLLVKLLNICIMYGEEMF